MSTFEELAAKERIRRAMDTDFVKQLENMSLDDHYYITKFNTPLEYWYDSLAVQTWLKLGLLKK
jgi:hypothetical protein